MKIIFFGSFQAYSVQVLQVLIQNFSVIAVITTPPKPAGRHMKFTPTEVQQYAVNNNLPVYPLESLAVIPKNLDQPDFIVVAGYGKLIPAHWLSFPTTAPINMHPSLLPDYRGRCPAEWAILRGEKQTGVSLVKMSAEFDKGEILAQTAIPIANDDTRQTIYAKLYDLGATLLVETLPKITKGTIIPRSQPGGNFFYARQITRQDGFVPWSEFSEALKNNPQRLDLKLRAFSGWPGVWSMMPNQKRIKLLALNPKPVVQLEGKKPLDISTELILRW